MDVWISFKGTQDVDGELNHLQFDTRGTLEKTERGYQLSYDESKSIGIDGVFTIIHVNDENVLLERQGALNSVLVLEKGRRTTSNYDMGYGSFTMGVFATDIKSNIQDSGGELSFKYNLDIESSFTSSHDISVTVNPNNGSLN